MPVYVLDPISPLALARLKERVAVVDWRDPAVEEWPERALGLIVRTHPVPAADIARARHLKVIAKHGVGFDNIPIPAAWEKGVTVVSTPGANAESVAEFTLGLAIAAARHIAAADRALRAGTSGKPALPSGRELGGRPLGVIGFGAVGRRVGALFRRAFGSAVSAYDPGLSDDEIRLGGAEPAALDTLLATSAVVSLHLPLTAQTRHVIDARALALMAPDSILINTARGGIVDEGALAAALAAGRPGAAASDVFEVEPPPPDHPLLRLPNFIATPHIGAATKEALDRVGLSVVEQVIDVLEGRVPPHVVTWGVVV